MKRSARFRAADLAALRLFHADYPMARCCLFYFYGEKDEYDADGVRVVPLSRALPQMPTLLGGD